MRSTTKMKILTIGQDRSMDLVSEINHWTQTECESDSSMTICLPIFILYEIQKRVGHGMRSLFVRQRIKEYLSVLKKRWGKPIPLFPSRSEFIRHAIMDFFLHEEDIILIDRVKEDSVDRYLKENGVKILREA